MTMKLTSMGTTFLNDLNVGLWQLKLQQKQHRTMSCKHLLLFVIILWLPYHFMNWKLVNLCKFPTFHEGDLRPDIVTRKDCLKAGEADFPPKRHTPEWWWWRWRRWWFHSLDNFVAVFFLFILFRWTARKKTSGIRNARVGWWHMSGMILFDPFLISLQAWSYLFWKATPWTRVLGCKIGSLLLEFSTVGFSWQAVNGSIANPTLTVLQIP